MITRTPHGGMRLTCSCSLLVLAGLARASALPFSLARGSCLQIGCDARRSGVNSFAGPGSRDTAVAWNATTCDTSMWLSSDVSLNHSCGVGWGFSPFVVAVDSSGTSAFLFGSYVSGMFALSTSGKLIWFTPWPFPTSTGHKPVPCVSPDGTIIVFAIRRPRTSHVALALDTTTGAILWNATGPYTFDAAPLMLPSGDVVLVDQLGFVVRLEGESGDVKWSVRVSAETIDSEAFIKSAFYITPGLCEVGLGGCIVIATGGQAIVPPIPVPAARVSFSSTTRSAAA